MYRNKEIQIKQEKPIYFWRVTKNYEIEKYVIDEYLFDRWSGGDRYIFYIHLKGNKNPVRRYIKADNFDRFVNNSFYSFDADDTKANEAILGTLQGKIDDLEKQTKRIISIMEQLQKGA